jgi:hypothetical protein
VALLSFLLSFIAKKVGNILQLVLGWSITALFGKLPNTSQIIVTVALALSLVWPLFLVGLAFPGVAGWAIALLPLEKWLGASLLRVLWSALALLTPAIVGLLVRIAAPTVRVNVWGSIVRGYPLTLGFFLAFVVVAVTVPMVKLLSAARGWTDEHVYVEPRPSDYDCVLRALAEACSRAGLLPEITDAPRQMAIATAIVRKLSQGSIAQIVTNDLRRIRAPGIEMYLYPADLLLRGEPSKVARVRAMMSRTRLDAHAYLVRSHAAQGVQDEVARLWAIVGEHERRGERAGKVLTTRVREVFRELMRTDVPYGDWIILESLVRRLERTLLVHGSEDAKLDEQSDRLEETAKIANGTTDDQEGSMEKEGTFMKEMARGTSAETEPLDDVSIPGLLTRALNEAKDLARLEIDLAKEDMKAEAKGAIRAGVGFGVAAGAGITTLDLLLLAGVLALGARPWIALGFGAVFLLLGTAAAAAAYVCLPKKPLGETRKRLTSDIEHLKEHAA